MKRKLVLAVVAALGLVAALPGAAWAPRIKLIPDAHGRCTVEQVEGTFNGASVEFLSFDVKETLLATVSATGNCVVTGTAGHGFDLTGPVPVIVSHATCDGATLALGGGLQSPVEPDSKERAVTVDLSEVGYEILGEKRDRGTACALARTRDPYRQARLLNAYLRS